MNVTLIGETNDVIFNLGTGTAEVDSKVYQHNESGEYLYTYQITNIDSSVDISFFSVGISSGSPAYDPAYDVDPFSDDINPTFYTTSGSPVQTVDYLFSNTIGIGQQSSLLYFLSSDGPGDCTCATLYGANVSADGYLLSPAPEPATITLLGSSGLWILMRKKKHIAK